MSLSIAKKKSTKQGAARSEFRYSKSQNNETAAIVVYQTNPVGVEPFSYEKTFFCSNITVWKKNALSI